MEKIEEKDWLIDVLKDSSEVKERENKRLVDKLKQLQEEKEWAETVAKNRGEGLDILEQKIDRLEDKVKQLKEEKEQLKSVSTKELVDELESREGCDYINAGFNDKIHLSMYGGETTVIDHFGGPAKILIVTD